MAVNDSLLSRVRKLLVLGDKNKNPDIHEAEAAAAKAQELIARHNISEAFLKIETGDTSVSEVISKMIHRSGRVSTWLSMLADAVAEVNGCAVYIVRGQGVMCVGEETDVAMVEVLVSYLEGEVVQRCKLSAHHYNQQLQMVGQPCMDKGQGRVYANRFKMGAMSALSARLRATKSKVEDEVRVLPSGTYALSIISSKLGRAKDALPKLGKPQTIRHRSCAHAYSKGVKAGNKIKLKPQTARLRG